MTEPKKIEKSKSQATFKWIAVVGVFLLFGFFELAARLFLNSKSERELIDIGELSFFSEINYKGDTYIKITSKYGYSEQNTIFRKKKFPDTKRIFIVGESASAGWPHPPQERFSSYLQIILNKMYPDANIEIINCSAHGFASYRVKKVFSSLIPYKPDVVIVWTGNNEFLEEPNYAATGARKYINALAENLKLVQMIKEAGSKSALNGNILNTDNSFWKKVKGQSIDLRSNPVLFGKVKLHYRQSLEAICREGQRNKVKVVLFTVPVNIRDWQPNVSYQKPEEKDSIIWRTAYNAGRKAMIRNVPENAIAEFKRAAVTEPLHAQTYFDLANAYLLKKDSLSALADFIKARDLDYNPFRVISDFNTTVLSLGKAYPQAVTVYNADSLFRNKARFGIPGFDLFLDYVHPNRKGNISLAADFSRFLAGKNMLQLAKPETEINEKELEKMLSTYQDEKDGFVQITRFSLCCLTRQYKSAMDFGDRILKDFPESYFVAENKQHELYKIRDGVDAFKLFLNTDRKDIFSQATLLEKQHANQALNNFYDKYFPYGTY